MVEFINVIVIKLYTPQPKPLNCPLILKTVAEVSALVYVHVDMHVYLSLTLKVSLCIEIIMCAKLIFSLYNYITYVYTYYTLEYMFG